MIWNKRITRIAVGLLLLACATLAILPSVTGHTSVDGTVNARFVTLSAPIEGTVQKTPPKGGTFIPGYGYVTGIKNERINRQVVASLEAELQTARRRLEAYKSQKQELTALRADLQARLAEFQQATIRNLEQEIAIARNRIGVGDAQVNYAQAELQRRTSLAPSGIVAGSSLEQARAAQVSASGEAQVARAQVERLSKQLESARKGVFIGDARNDVPYSRQRMDEVTIQLADLDARTRETQARIEQLTRQLGEETVRVERQEDAEIVMPFNGVIWRNSVVAGSNVVVGQEISRILDCRELFVDMIVSENISDEIKPGQKGEMRLYGSDTVLPGTVVSVRGSASVVEEPTLAATPPSSRGKNARIRLLLEQFNPIQEDYANYCQVGRTVQVRFDGKTFPFKRWIRSIWFSII